MAADSGKLLEWQRQVRWTVWSDCAHREDRLSHRLTHRARCIQHSRDSSPVPAVSRPRGALRAGSTSQFTVVSTHLALARLIDVRSRLIYAMWRHSSPAAWLRQYVIMASLSRPAHVSRVRWIGRSQSAQSYNDNNEYLHFALGKSTIKNTHHCNKLHKNIKHIQSTYTKNV